MKSLTIAYITSRDEPMLDWFVNSLERQSGFRREIDVIVVQSKSTAPLRFWHRHVDVKPTVWQGKFQVPKDSWWGAANARNTAICLCRTKWLACVDDRCVLMPGWIEAIKRAMEGDYAVCGAYEKRTGVTVDNGVIMNAGIVIGEDTREKHTGAQFIDAPGEWMFGCNFALPLEWALAVNGFDENCDSLGMEDCIFGLMLANNGFKIKYDPAMKIIEDRTPEHCGPVMKRTDKGVSPNDKSHALLHKLRGLKSATHPINLREIRRIVLAANPFPNPWGPEVDWYDGQPVKDF